METPPVTPDSLFPPAAYIIGAPKCGTTALAEYLSQHPLVGFCEMKEPHYYTKEFEGLKLYHDAASFRAAFPAPLPPGSLLMEGSVFYLQSRDAIPAILAARPDARFLAMLRNPVAMAPSLHRQMLNSLDEDVDDFDAAWALSDARGRGQSIPRLCRNHDMIRYPVACALADQVERFFALVPPAQRLVMLQEDLKADAGAVYRRALAFFGLPDDGRQTFPIVNEANAPRSRAVKLLTQRPWPWLHAPLAPIKRLLGVKSFGVMRRLADINQTPTGGAKISAETRAMLSAHFAEDTARLSALLQRDLAAEAGWPTAAPVVL